MARRCDIVRSLMITLFRHQRPRHPGEGGHRRHRHRHRPPPLHREARGRVRVRWPVHWGLRGPVSQTEKVIKWGLKLTPSNFIMYRNVHWGWVTDTPALKHKYNCMNVQRLIHQWNLSVFHNPQTKIQGKHFKFLPFYFFAALTLTHSKIQ